MHKKQMSKIGKVVSALMLLAAIQMSIPAHTYAAVADQVHSANTTTQSIQLSSKANKKDDGKGTYIPYEDGKTDADLRCTGIYVGSSLTTNGDTFIGRSEDLNGNNRKDFEYVPPADHDPSTDFYYDIDNGDGDFKIPMPAHTVGYTCIHDNPNEWDGDATKPVFAANGINDNGVAITSTVTTDVNKTAAQADNFKSGLGEIILGDILLGQSTSAKNACEIAGKLIDQYGAVEGYQFFAADKDDAWMFAALSGSQWVAFRLPKDQISVNPNIGGLKYDLNLSDTENVMHSANIEKLAKDTGIAQYKTDGSFDIFGTYGDMPSARNMSRYWMGTQYFVGTEKANELEQNPQLFFPSNKKYDTYTILRALGYRGEGTKYDAENGATWFQGKNDAPYREKPGVYPVGNMNQLQTHFFQVRTDANLPAGLRIIQWECMGPAAYGTYLPLYTGLMTKLPAIYNPGPTEHSKENALVENVDAQNSMYYTMNDFNKLVSYAKTKGADISKIKTYLETTQKDLIEQAQVIENLMKKLDPSKYTTASNKIAEVLSNNLHARTVKLNEKLRAYIKANDFTQPIDFAELDDTTSLTNGLFENGQFVNIGTDASRPLTYDPAKTGATAADTPEGQVDPVNPNEAGDTSKPNADNSPSTSNVKPQSNAKTLVDTGDATSLIFPVVLGCVGVGLAYFGYKNRKK